MNNAENIIKEVVHRFKSNAGNNQKLGKMYSWSIPPRDTCPGKTEICARLCYVDGYTRRYPNTLTSYERNLEISKHPDFKEILKSSLHRLPTGLLRLHVSGDFYSVKYAQTWFEALDANPHIKPFGFTRSWRAPKILAVFRKHGPPAWLFASTDPDTGPAPEGFREAQMSLEPLYMIKKGVLPRPKFICDEQMNPQTVTCASCGRCPTVRIKDGQLVQLPKAVMRHGVVFAQH